jgi:hypothetical protein
MNIITPLLHNLAFVVGFATTSIGLGSRTAIVIGVVLMVLGAIVK